MKLVLPNHAILPGDFASSLPTPATTLAGESATVEALIRQKMQRGGYL
jgi:hypothetical protein